MAQGDSIVGICNGGLIALGEDPITSLTDPTKRAILCNANYDRARRQVLRAAPWSCAKKMALLAASSTPPAFKWANAFPLPADFIRLWETGDTNENAGGSLVNWEVMNGQVLTDEGAPLPFVYVFDLKDPTQFDPLLAQRIGLELAKVICVSLTGSDAKLNDIKGQIADTMGAATLVDSQSDGPQEMDDDIWLRSRR